MSLLFFTDEDFKVQDGIKSKVMCHGTKGLTVILFYSPSCPVCYCTTYVNSFRKLPATINECNFGIVNVNNNRGCITKSKGTISEIDSVPFILLYIDGRPFMKYEGSPDISEIKNFIKVAKENLQKKQQFVRQQNQQQQQMNGMQSQYSQPKQAPVNIPTEGIPVVGDKNSQACYVKVNEKGEMFICDDTKCYLQVDTSKNKYVN